VQPSPRVSAWTESPTQAFGRSDFGRRGAVRPPTAALPRLAFLPSPNEQMCLLALLSFSLSDVILGVTQRCQRAAVAFVAAVAGTPLVLVAAVVVGISPSFVMGPSPR